MIEHLRILFKNSFQLGNVFIPKKQYDDESQLVKCEKGEEQ